jgi:hypothetical protein
LTLLDFPLDSDPSIRRHVLRDFGDAPREIIGADRTRVATKGGVPGCWPCKAK